MQDWLIQQEQLADETANRVGFNLRRAHLYIRAGYIQDGIEALQDVLIQAWNEQNDLVFQQVKQGLVEYGVTDIRSLLE